LGVGCFEKCSGLISITFDPPKNIQLPPRQE
jgi:hypothetical protein